MYLIEHEEREAQRMATSEDLQHAIDEVLSDGVRRGMLHNHAEDDVLDGRHVTIGGRRLVNFGSCSYLGLETHPRLKAAVVDAVERFGTQFSSSRGYTSAPLYREAEAELTALFGRTITRTAPLELLLFPVFDPDTETARLVPTETERSARMLTECYVSLSSKGEDFLLGFFDLSDTGIRDRLAALGARQLPGIPAYELRQSHRTNEQAARLIGDLLA